MGGGIAVGSDVDAATVLSRAAEHLERNEQHLAARVSDRCYAELESYRVGTMPREESRRTVSRLLSFVVQHLRKSPDAVSGLEAERLHGEMVSFEEGIAARRVHVQIEFTDLMMGLHFMADEVWQSLRDCLSGRVTADEFFVLERRLNRLFDRFFLDLSGAYLRSAADTIASHEQALQKWEEVVRSAAEIRLKIPCENEFAAVVRLQAEAIARRAAFTEEEIYDIVTAVGEVCDNAIEHGCSELGIDVVYRFAPTEISVEVRDYGPGFNPAGRGEEIPDLFSERGRGIFLMKHLMDRVEIDSRSGEGTRVVLVKSRD
ncbi:MAG: ATP-binding protein [Candidatus Eremiobacterota bacterium]